MKTTNQRRNHRNKQGAMKSIISSLLLIALLILSLIIYRESMGEIFDGICQVTWQQIMVSTLLSVLYYVLEGMIIHHMASMVVAGFTPGNGVSVAFTCEFYRLITIGSGAGIAEIYYLNKKGIKPALGTVITILQYIMKKAGLTIIGVISFIVLYYNESTKIIFRKYYAFLWLGIILTLVVIFILFFIILSPSFVTVVIKLLEKVSRMIPFLQNKIQSLKEQITQLNVHGKNIIRKKEALVKIVLFNLIKLSAIYSIPAYLLFGKSQLTTVQCFMIMAVVYMLAGIIPAPSGIGSLEFVFILFFGVFVETGIVVPAILVFRFVTWVFPFVIGGILVFASRMKDITWKSSN